jgi:hypothetical protein
MLGQNNTPVCLTAQNSLLHAVASTSDLGMAGRVRGNKTQHTRVPVSTKTLAGIKWRGNFESLSVDMVIHIGMHIRILHLRTMHSSIKMRVASKCTCHVAMQASSMQDACFESPTRCMICMELSPCLVVRDASIGCASWLRHCIALRIDWNQRER